MLYSAQAKKGEEFSELTPAISISILGFNLFKESNRVQEIFDFRNADNSLTLPPTMSLHYIDLTRFNRKKPHELQSPFEKWLHLMKFSKAYNACFKSSLSLAELSPGEHVGVQKKKESGINNAFALDFFPGRALQLQLWYSSSVCFMGGTEEKTLLGRPLPSFWFFCFPYFSFRRPVAG